MPTCSVHGCHVDVRAATRASLHALQLLLKTLQLEDERALLRAQSLQHGLFLDQSLGELMQTTFELCLAAAAQSLIGQLENEGRKERKEGRERRRRRMM